MAQFPSTTSASGEWTLKKQKRAQQGGNWPVFTPNDPYFNYVTMLLHGDGTNGGQNNTLLDSSTNNYTITRNGNTTQGSFSPYGANWSNSFGSGNYLTTPSNAAFAFGTGDFTIEMWLYVNAYTSGAGHLIGPHTQNVGADWWLVLLDTGYLKFNIGNGSAGDPASTAVTPLNTWTHIAVVKSSGVYTFYINGTAAGTTSNSTSIACTRTVGIGAPNNGSVYPFNGYISNLRVVKGTAVYTSAFTPSTTPLTSITNTQLLTCQSNRFIDNSSNTLALTSVGSVSVQRFSPFAPSAAYSTATIGGSGYFDGTGDYLTVGNVLNLGSGDLTIEFWMNSAKQASLNTNPYTIVSGEYSGSGVLWSVGVFDYGGYHGLTFGYGQYGSYTVGITTNNYLGSNTWQHIAITRASGTWRIFVNGVSQTLTVYNENGTWNANFNFTNTTATSRNIGATTTPSNYFKGYMNGFRIVVGTAVYTAAFTPPTAPLTAVSGTSLLLNYTNGAIYDNAMMNDLETVGNAKISTSVVKYGTGSIVAGDPTVQSYSISRSNQIWQMGNQDFTLELWLYPTQYTNDATFFRIGDGTNIFYFMIYNAKLCVVTNGYSPGLGYSLFDSVSLNQWSHLAITRQSNVFYGFVNGIKSANSYSLATNLSTANPMWAQVGDQAANRLLGYMDDVRFTKGYARYTANFTPPTAAFPNQ